MVIVRIVLKQYNPLSRAAADQAFSAAVRRSILDSGGAPINRCNRSRPRWIFLEALTQRENIDWQRSRVSPHQCTHLDD